MSNHSNKRWALSIKYTILSTVLAVPLLTVLPQFTQKTFAENNNYQQPKVAICHRTNSVTKPYVYISIDKNAYDGQHDKSNRKSDHYGEHEGAVVKSTEEAKELKEQKTKWGDKYISEVSRGKSDKKNYSDNECVVGDNKPINDDDKKDDVKHEDKKHDDCDKETDKPKDDDKPVVVTPIENTPAKPQVIGTTTQQVVQPTELAKTGVNPVLASIVGLGIISTVGLLFRKTKPVVEKNFDYTI